MSPHPAPKGTAAEPQAASAVLMIRPRHFGSNAETAASNRFQALPAAHTPAGVAESYGGAAESRGGSEPESHGAGAAGGLAEFDGLVAALVRAGVAVHTLDGRDTPVCPDEIFPNNWFSTHADGTLVLYPMLAPSRRLERREDVVDALRRLDYDVRRIVDLTDLEPHGLFLEGTGSLVLDRRARLAFACLSARTSAEAVRTFCERMGYEPVVFDARDRDGHAIYHTNVMMSVGTEVAVVCSDAIREAQDRRRVLGALRASGKRIVEIGYPQLHAFAGNVLELRGERGALIALSQRALDSLEPEQRRALAEHGALTAAPLDTIETFGGGSVRCMLAELHLPPARPPYPLGPE